MLVVPACKGVTARPSCPDATADASIDPTPILPPDVPGGLSSAHASSDGVGYPRKASKHPLGPLGGR